jgi:hypothetical protein
LTRENQVTSIPADVHKFISDHIFTVERFDILLLLADRPEKEWTLAEVCRAFGVSPAIAVMRLTGLKTSDLIVSRAAGEMLYRYAPTTPALQAVASRLMEICRPLPRSEIARLIYGR